MIKFLINRPIAVIVFLITFVFLGVLSAFRIPYSLLPNIDIPEITIKIDSDNHDSKLIQELYVDPIREQMLVLDKIKDIECEALDGKATISLAFNHGANIDYLLLEVNEKIDALMFQFPKSFKRPRVYKYKESDYPVLTLSVYYKDSVNYGMLELSNTARNSIIRRIEQLPEVAMVDYTGLYMSEIIISPNYNMLAAHNISLEELIAAVNTNNNIHLNTQILNGSYIYSLSIVNHLEGIEDVKNIYLNVRGKLFQLNELCHITEKSICDGGGSYINNKNAVVMSIIKRDQANVYDLKTRFNALINQFKNDYPSLSFKITNDQTNILSASLENLIKSLIIGGILAIAIMFIVLKDNRNPFLIGISIPSSLFVSLLVFHQLGLSINIISLSGLLLGTGMMIDNSIIVLDNIGYYRKNNNLVKSVVKGVNEVIIPLLTSSLTTCAVFIPLVFISGLAGEVFFDQAIAVCSGLMVSFIVSIFVLPVLYYITNKSNGTKKISVESNKLLSIYEKGLIYCIQYKYFVFVIFLCFIPLSTLLFSKTERSIIPNISRSNYTVLINWNESISNIESFNRIKSYKNFSDDSQLTANVFIGNQSFNFNHSLGDEFDQVHLDIESSESIDEETIVDVVNYFKSKFPEATINYYPTRSFIEDVFTTDLADYEIKLFGDNTKLSNYNGLFEIASIISSKNSSISEIDLPNVEESYILNINREKALLYNINLDELIMKLRSVMSSSLIDRIRINDIYTPIKIGVAEITDISDLYEQLVSTQNGNKLPIKNFITIRKEYSPKKLHSNKFGRYLPVKIHLNEELNISKIEKVLDENDSLLYSIGGRIRESEILMNDLIYILIVTVILLYFILAAQFESLLQPLIILTEVLIDVSGALILLKLFGESLNIMSATGIIVMCGIIINDSIIKLDTINSLRKSGITPADSVKVAGERRFNPIVMTSITTILALVPLFFTNGLGVEMQKPFAIAIIGGLFLGTIVSLYFLPIFYLVISRLQKQS